MADWVQGCCSGCSQDGFMLLLGFSFRRDDPGAAMLLSQQLRMSHGKR